MEFKVPTREELSDVNQKTYDAVNSQLGFVPNLYTYMAKHPNALQDYLTFLNRKSSLNPKEKELVSLVVSQYNNCVYCQSAHTALGKMSGLSDEEIISIRRGDYDNDQKLRSLLNLTISLLKNNGQPETNFLNDFISNGYNENNFIDVVYVIADKYITNFIARTASIEIDFPTAEEL